MDAQPPAVGLMIDDPWLGAVWPFVRAHLAAPPARVVELGCGRLGGFVPELLANGYATLGVDPDAPEGSSFRRVEFERAEFTEQADAVIASTSLHHVADPAAVVHRISDLLVRGGALVIVEWDWERFDEPTATWCFERLGAPEPETWLHRLQREWVEAGTAWEAFLAGWAQREAIHPWRELAARVDECFEGDYVADGPYFFPDLRATSDADERAAIEVGRIRATRVEYVARKRG